MGEIIPHSEGRRSVVIQLQSRHDSKYVPDDIEINIGIPLTAGATVVPRLPPWYLSQRGPCCLTVIDTRNVPGPFVTTSPRVQAPSLNKGKKTFHVVGIGPNFDSN